VGYSLPHRLPMEINPSPDFGICGGPHAPCFAFPSRPEPGAAKGTTRANLERALERGQRTRAQCAILRCYDRFGSMDGGSVHGRRPSDNPSIAAVLLHRSEFPGSAKAL